MIIGTNHFLTFSLAVKYYKDYGYEDTKKAVRRKIDEYEIVIGPPSLKPGEKLVYLDNGTRYGIDDGKK